MSGLQRYEQAATELDVRCLGRVPLKEQQVCWTQQLAETEISAGPVTSPFVTTVAAGRRRVSHQRASAIVLADSRADSVPSPEKTRGRREGPVSDAMPGS